MAKKGRPFVYQSDTEKPVTVSLRIPRDVYQQVERYVKMHPGMTLTEFMLDGIRLRLDTPADPRDIILSDDNTVIQEVQEMIRAAVQREVGKLSAFIQPHSHRQGVIPPAEAATAPVPALSHDENNTVIQEKDTAPSDAPEAVDAKIAQHITRLEDRIHEIQHDDNITVIQESLVEAAVTPPDDIQYYDNNTVIQEETAPMSDVGGTPAAARPRRGIPKLTPRQVKALRAKRAKGAKIEMLMAQYGISKATVFRYLA